MVNTKKNFEKDELELVIMNQEVAIKSLQIEKKRLGARVEEIDHSISSLGVKITENKQKLTGLEHVN